jgi:hypothetical protein
MNPPLVSVDEVAAAPEKYVGLRLRVQGQVHVHEEFSRRPCIETDPAGCPDITAIELQLITPNRPAGSSGVVRLFRARGAGFAPVTCVQGRVGQYVCTPFVAGEIAIVSGTLTKQVVTTGSVVDPNGVVTPIQQSTIYFLVID